MIKNKEKWITYEEMLDVAKMVTECANTIHYEPYRNQPIKLDAWVDETETTIKITFKLCKEKITWKLDKDNRKHSNVSVGTVCSEFSRTYPIQKVEEILGIKRDKTLNMIDHKPNNFRMNIGSAKGHHFNINKDGKEKVYETQAWEYDMSQAYGQMLKLPLPDTPTCRKDSFLEANEIGFIKCGATRTGTQLRMVEEPGLFCDYCFKQMQSPYIDKVNKIMEQITLETDELKILELKNKFRYFVGQLQNVNPFWRATVIERCNNLIKSLSDNNTIYSNTDSIVSRVERKDIEQLVDIKFKSKHQGQTFRLSKSNKDFYQWNDELPTVSGKQKLYVEYYNKTHSKPFILNENELPAVTGHEFELKILEDGCTIIKNKWESENE